MGSSQTEPLPARLRRLRTERGLSQRALQGPGVSYAYISRIEAGQRTPSVKALRVLASKLGVSTRHLETGEVEPLEEALLGLGLSMSALDESELERLQIAAAAGAREAVRVAALRLAAERAETLSETLAAQARAHRVEAALLRTKRAVVVA